MDLLDYVNNNLDYCNSFLDIDFTQFYIYELMNGSYHCNRYKDLELNKKYLNHIYYILNDLSFDKCYFLTDNQFIYTYNDFISLFFENIELFTVKFLRYLYLKEIVLNLELKDLINSKNKENSNYSYDIFKINLISFCDNLDHY